MGPLPCPKSTGKKKTKLEALLISPRSLLLLYFGTKTMQHVLASYLDINYLRNELFDPRIHPPWVMNFFFFVCHDQNEVYLEGGTTDFSLVSHELARKDLQVQIMQEVDFDATVKVIDIVKRVLSCVGTWPEKKPVHELLFVLTVIYMTIHSSLAFIDTAMNISDITYVVACSMENVFVLVALLKNIVCKMRQKSLATFLEGMRSDLVAEKYQTMEEKMAVLNYNDFSKKFVTLILTAACIAAPLYYVMLLANNIEMTIANSSVGYKLPYKVYLVIEPTNLITYICLCLYQMLFLPCVILSYGGTDCLFVIFVLHVSGLFSALSCKVKHVLADPFDRERRMKQIIKIHVRLIRLAQNLEDDFNIIIFIQLIGVTFTICLIGYDALVSLVVGEKMMLLTFVLIVCGVSSILLAYCYIGECLIRESLLLGDTFYQCEWYNISSKEKKLMHICMTRATRHLRLTSGKFCILSLDTFTDVLNTAMAYFSVLRSFL